MGTTREITEFGAHPEDADNTIAVQNAIDGVTLGDTVRVPPDIFLVQGEKLRGRSGVDLRLDGFLKVIPNNASIYRLLVLESVSDIHIWGNGGGFMGSREAYPVLTPDLQHGHNLALYGCNRVIVERIISQDARGDNIYISGTNVPTTNSSILNNTLRNAMRSNMSLIDIDTVNVLNNRFERANGPAPMPMAGIDIEPDKPDQRIVTLTVARNIFTKNKGAGVYVATGNTQNVHHVNVSANTYDQHYKDGSGPPIRGVNDQLGWFLYNFRFIPGWFDWQGFPTEYHIA